MQFVRDLGVVLRQGAFRRLFAVRLSSQLTDGVFHVALAAYVLFSPETRATAPAIAAGFAALLLPFSVLGPFCGVLIDRWSRRQILFWSNLVRVGAVIALAAIVAVEPGGIALLVLALGCLSVNRFLLAALSASMPHVVPRHELVMANSVSPTCGTLSYLVGVGIGSGLQLLFRPLVDRPNAVVLLLAAGGYAGAALLALRLQRRQLGPDLFAARPAVRESVRHILLGLRDGARHVVSRRPAAYGLAAIGVHRFVYGLATMATILLYRNYFHPGDEQAALAGAAVAVMAAGVGYGVAAFATPIAVNHVRKESWIAALLVLGAVAQLALAPLYTRPAIIAAAFVLGISAQGIKICVDTLVHESVDDVFRGRVFSFYDVLFNVVFVASAAVAAWVLPETGRAPGLLVAGAIFYLCAAAGYTKLTARARTGDPAVPIATSRTT